MSRRSNPAAPATAGDAVRRSELHLTKDPAISTERGSEKAAPISVLQRDERVTTAAREIRSIIQTADTEMRQQYGWLRYQDGIGALLVVLSLAAIGVLSYFTCMKVLPVWLAVPLIALPLSVLHEIEHDLIHNQYFGPPGFVQNVMYTIIWIAKLHGNP
jgi:hypothetical protein